MLDCIGGPFPGGQLAAQHGGGGFQCHLFFFGVDGLKRKLVKAG